MIAIIDYDAGNLKSVEKAFDFIGAECIVTRDKDVILKADKVVLPGVGSFGDAMEKLHKYDLVDTIKAVVANNTPFIGICLGLQLLFEESDETPGDMKVPHMGWNSLKLSGNGRLFDGINDGEYVYFVHSYYLEAEDENIVKASTEYGVHIHASVEQGNVFACQYHPEKSSDAGLKMLKNFASL